MHFRKDCNSELHCILSSSLQSITFHHLLSILQMEPVLWRHDSVYCTPIGIYNVHTRCFIYMPMCGSLDAKFMYTTAVKYITVYMQYNHTSLVMHSLIHWRWMEEMVYWEEKNNHPDYQLVVALWGDNNLIQTLISLNTIGIRLVIGQRTWSEGGGISHCHRIKIWKHSIQFKNT